jgi:hypothetical protein
LAFDRKRFWACPGRHSRLPGIVYWPITTSEALIIAATVSPTLSPRVIDGFVRDRIRQNRSVALLNEDVRSRSAAMNVNDLAFQLNTRTEIASCF